MAISLITGANGFVGQRLCAQMLARGWSVRGTIFPADALVPVGIVAMPMQSIGPASDWTQALDGVDVVIHLAARVHIMKESVSNPLHAFREVNVAGTERLARMAAAAGVKHFIFISSVKVNGEGKAAPYTELDDAAPEDAYGLSKWEAELALRHIANDSSLKITILRLPLVYGPGVKANFLRLMDSVYRGIPLPLKNIDNKRSFIYLDNLIDAILHCMNRPVAFGKTYFVSDSEAVSTQELIQRLAAALGKPARLLPVPLRLLRFAGQLLGKSSSVERLLGSLFVDISKIYQELGWRPPYTQIQGFQETADWYLRHRRFD